VLLYDYAPYDPTGAYGTGAPTPYDHTVALEVAGLGGARAYDAVVLSDSGRRSLSGTTDGGGGLGLVMPGESVALVTLHAGEARARMTLDVAGQRQRHRLRGGERAGAGLRS
jgi:hypothetical protein